MSVTLKKALPGKFVYVNDNIMNWIKISTCALGTLSYCVKETYFRENTKYNFFEGKYVFRNKGL